MMLTHLIGGEQLTGKHFSIKGQFNDYPISLDTPSLEERHIVSAKTALSSVTIPPLGDRKQIIRTLTEYSPSQETIEAVCKFTGVPCSLVEEKIKAGKSLAHKIAELDSSDSRKSVFVGIPPNDPREYFYFISHFILAGSPAVIKLSSREPILGLDIVKYLQTRGLPDGLLNVIYADTSSLDQAALVARLIEHIDLPIIMGSAKISGRQLSYDADLSKAVVLDAEAAIPHLDESVLNPLSCLTEKNYIVVGKENFEKMIKALCEAYSSLKPGNILSPKTTLGLINEATLKDVHRMLLVGTIVGSMRVLYPYDCIGMDLTKSGIEAGTLVEHYAEDVSAGPNPLMTSSLPLYLTGVRYAKNMDEVLRDLNNARATLKEKQKVEKSMAIAIYGEDADKHRQELERFAFDIHINESTSNVNPERHQGIYINKILTQ